MREEDGWGAGLVGARLLLRPVHACRVEADVTAFLVAINVSGGRNAHCRALWVGKRRYGGCAATPKITQASA